jgi:hypothetical protein
MRRLAFPVLLLLAAPACNGNVIIDNPSVAASSSSGGSGSGSAGGTSGVVGSSGVGGAPSCKETHDTLSVTLSTWKGETFACGQGNSDTDFYAAVLDTPGPGLFVLDSCSPGADCIPFISKLSITAPGLATDVPKGAYVKVHVAIDDFMGGCAQRIEIKNLPFWDGAPNPVMPGDFVWFLGVDGTVTAFVDSWFTAAPEPLSCYPGQQGGCGLHDDYRWHFQLPNNPAEPGVLVPMGDTVYWGAPLPNGFEYVSAHNLRSLSTGACDGPNDFAYWIKHEYPLD